MAVRIIAAAGVENRPAAVSRYLPDRAEAQRDARITLNFQHDAFAC